MQRRDFVAGLGAGTYSLVVLAEDLVGQGRHVGELTEITNQDSRHSLGGVISAISPEQNMRLVEQTCDVLIAGGGPAGVCAALAAARHGAKVVLLQDRSRLGGNSSSEVKMHIVGANCHKGRPGWRESGIIEELRLEDAVRNPERCFELWDFLLYDKIVSEENVTLLLDTALYSAQLADSRIQHVMARCDRTETLFRISADIFVDCTGDGRLGLEAGADMRYGRESRSEHGESLAPDTADRETMGSSILFTSRDYGRPIPFTPPFWARKVTREHLRFRSTNAWEYGYWWIEWGGKLNTIRDNERIRFELLSILMGVWDYIKNSGDHPSSETWALDWVGMIPGKRESRRLMGDHVLFQQDLESGYFEDAVAIGGWPLDDHPPGGFDRADLEPARQIRTDDVYNIPLRSLYSRNVPNLMMAGRNLSATHVALSSTRVMATCSVLGQAVGTAAAQCVSHELLPRELAGSENEVLELQQTLLRDDQTIRGVKNEDPLDLARSATASASSERPEAPATNVINGWTRDFPRSPLYPQAVVNHWSAEMSPQGAWIEVAWARPQEIRHVQITFDTGFERELTLTASDGINNGIVRAAQPETVKDYRIIGRKGDDATIVLADVGGNYQRLRRHDFEPVQVNAIRIHVTATNGSHEARIFEVRCYG